jgi:GDP-L-fucose synthase
LGFPEKIKYLLCVNLQSKIFIAGHRGMVGSAIDRALETRGYSCRIGRSSRDLDLTRQADVEAFFEKERPEIVVLAAARVGGILANSQYPTEFLYQNLMMEANVIQSAERFGVERLLFLGSSCIYPKLAPQPLKEEYLLTGSLEPTNEAYALAKIAGLKLTEYYHRQYGRRFVSVMPSNLYGPGDNYHPDQSHVIPGLIRRFHEAKIAKKAEVTVWGTGTPLREFLHVDDLARACVDVLERYSEPQFLNVGSGEEVTIRKLANLIAQAVGFEGEIVFDPTKPDGTPRKVLDSTRIQEFGWRPEITLEEGLKGAYQDFLRAGPDR